ncbi:unnamed protein product, partial [Phaeothamnion confervicola]
MADYIKARGGSLVIRKVLLANNGMASTKAILSMRQWAYLELGDEKAIEFVVMATPEASQRSLLLLQPQESDLAANAEFIRLADAIVEVPGGSNRNNYANVDLIVEVAKKEKVDAVWPGWGHASENPRLPTQLTAAGIKFIGPTAPVMAVLGDKIAANILAQTAKVPSIPWSGQGLTADLTDGPPVIVPKETFTQMERAAQRLTQNIGYRGAGTVEYLYNPKENKFYFLELNPRLQVEHPVTEGLSFANVPSIQLQVAMGIPLHMIPDIRQFYGRERYGSDAIKFLEEPYAPINNHIIAARITAENPDEGFKPTSGTIERIKFQSTSNVWGYFSVGANGGIHEYADSQFGHLFASGPTREAARKNLVLALKEIEVRGEIRTTVEYLVQLLETKEFKENTIDTSWLDGLIRAKAVGIELEPHSVVTSAVLWRAFAYCRESKAAYMEQLAKGQTGLIGLKGINSFPIEISYEGIKYSFQVTRTTPDTFKLVVNGQTVDVRVREQRDGSLLATFGGSTSLIFGMEEPLGLRIKLDGKTVMLPNIFDPSELRADVAGKIVRFLQEDGAAVRKDEPYVEVRVCFLI